jgi:hypothetical protein
VETEKGRQGAENEESGNDNMRISPEVKDDE